MEYLDTVNINSQVLGVATSGNSDTQQYNQRLFQQDPSFSNQVYTPSILPTSRYSTNLFGQSASSTLSHAAAQRRTSVVGLYTFPAGESDDLPRPRLTGHQVRVLEKHFSQSPKPNSAVKRALAESTGLSLQRVGNWFQNRRQKAKMLKQQEEEQTLRVLESAGRRRNTFTVPSSPSTIFGSKEDLSSVRNFRASSSTVPHTPLKSLESQLYTSNAEASYASLERSLAEAAAHVAQHNVLPSNDMFPTENGQSQEHTPMYDLSPLDMNFMPSSAFSDWGSSTCYTPTPFTQNGDPFEFDRSARPSPFIPSSMNRSNCVAPVFQDNYSEFAAAIEMKALQSTAAMSLKPPPTSKRAVVPSTIAENAEAESVMNKPELKLNTDLVSVLPSSPSPTSRRGSRILPTNLKLPRSFISSETPSHQVEDPIRRIRSVNGSGRVQKIIPSLMPRSPLRMQQSATEAWLDNTTNSDEFEEVSLLPSPVVDEITHNSSTSSAESLQSHSETDMEYSDANSLPSTPGTQTPPTHINTHISSIETVVPQPQRVTDFHRIFEHTTPAFKDGTSYFNFADGSFGPELGSLDLSDNNTQFFKYTLDNMAAPDFFDLDSFDMDHGVRTQLLTPFEDEGVSPIQQLINSE